MAAAPRPVARREPAEDDDDFERVVERIKARNAHLDEQEIYDLIDEAVDAVRAGRKGTMAATVARREPAEEEDGERRRFERAVARIRARAAHLDEREACDLIDEAVDAVRAGRS